MTRPCSPTRSASTSPAAPNPHLAFGWGVHFCLGASLARLELAVALQTMIERYDRLEVVGDYHWIPNARLSGLKTLPLQTRRAQ